MTLVWLHRPRFGHLALFFAAYLLGCGFAQALAIVPGITVSIWPPGGVFIATLIFTSPYSWPWWIVAACLAEMAAQVALFHSPLAAGFLIYVGNALGAVVGAGLVNRVCGRPVRLETLQELLAFIVLGAGVGPLISATVGSATLAGFGVEAQAFSAVWPLFWIGDATGILLIAPPALIAIQHWRGEATLSAAQWTEAAVLGIIFLVITELSLSAGYLPSPYIALPPLLWVAVRFEFRGAAVALALLALTTLALTVTGTSQFIGDPESQRERQVMLQLFLAISAFSALIVASISRQHQQVMLAMRRGVEELRERERELSQFIDLVPSHVWRLRPDGEPVFFNRRMVDFIGMDVADTDKPGSTRLTAMIEAAVHPDDAVAFGDTLRRCLATGGKFALRYRLRRADGAYHWMSSRAEPLRDADGHILQWYGICHDIDEQVRLYSEIEEREARIRRLIDSDIIGIVIWDLDGRLIDANDAFLRMIQYERKDLESGIDWLAMTPPEWQEVHSREEAEELARTGKMQAREKEYFRKDGSRVPVLIGAACFEGQSRQGVAYILDLTKRKQAEAGQMRAEHALRQTSEQLARASQAASLAELSASIAHEVNQPLAAIVANSHACHRWLSADPPNVERAKVTAERIIRDANSAADVVGHIRALFKQSSETRGLVRLASVVSEARDLMADEAVARQVRIEITIDNDLPPVALDRVQIQQVLVNLMRNGIEAMSEVSGDRSLRIRARRTPEGIRTEVYDNGVGIEHPEKVFEPFFTTKREGMGMGLAICRSIIESHGGRLWAEDAEAQGARFVFTLPVEPQQSS